MKTYAALIIALISGLAANISVAGTYDSQSGYETTKPRGTTEKADLEKRVAMLEAQVERLKIIGDRRYSPLSGDRPSTHVSGVYTRREALFPVGYWR